jgi:hypothetical protein
MKDDEKLPREIVWDGAHVSELALTALADGQDPILPSDAIDHAGTCEWCAGRLGRAALLSSAMGEAIEQVRPSRAPSKAVPSPWRALALGVTVAVLAAIPSLPGLVSGALGLVSYGREFTAHGVPVLAKGGAEILSSGALPLATLVASALLVIMGCAVARTRSAVSAERSLS